MNPSAGIGDPYFYEWTIGLEKIISLMSPEEGLQNVTLQSTVAGSLDDVVCKYDDTFEFIQVKHTRSDETFGFSALLNGEHSLLSKLSSSWKKLYLEGRSGKAKIITNRRPVRNVTTIKRNSVDIRMPSFEDFWVVFEEVCKNSSDLSEIRSNLPEKWEFVFELIIEELNDFEDDHLKAMFLKCFSIKYDYPDIDKLDTDILNKLMILFSINENKASLLYEKLFFALKEWASSTRSKEEVTVEDVYSKLSVFENSYPDLNLLPPEPFFESRKSIIKQIENKCLRGKERIIFLYGNPGIGKTSLINYLTQKIDTIVDLRYYTYVPIVPNSSGVNPDFDDSVTSEKLWGSLLNQLRILFKGKLFENKVPINSTFMSESEMVSQVLRLASVYAKKQGKKTIIVIDGIDHAARSGTSVNFLKSLIAPEHIPTDVKFIISGQPSDSYQEYPIWLNPENPLIDSIELCGVTETDIHSLITDINPELKEKDLFAREIHHFSHGNTLSAIFAAYETLNVENIEELLSLLRRKELSSSLLSYYDHIWSSRLFQQTSTDIINGNILAGLFVILKEKIHISEFSKIFTDSLISELDWKIILKQYSPLIICKEDYYYLYHNDIRVFLERKVRSENIPLRSIASSLVDYYKVTPEKVQIKHSDLFRLLEISNRSDEKIDLFNLEYVKEAFEIGQNITSLIKQFQDVCVSFENKFDENKLANLTITSIVLNQYVKVLERYDMTQVPEEYQYFTSEFKRINLGQISLDEVNSVLEDIFALYNLNEIQRAKRTFKKWFSETEVLLKNARINDSKGSQIWSKRKFESIIFNVAYLSIVLGCNINPEFNKEVASIRDIEFKGEIEGIIEKDDLSLFISKISDPRNNDNLTWVLETLYKNRKINWIRQFIDLYHNNTTLSLQSEISYNFFKAVTSKSHVYPRITDFLYSSNAIEFFLDRDLCTPFVCAQISFLCGRSSSGSRENIVERIVDLFFSIPRDDRGKDYFKSLMSTCFDIGNYVNKSKVTFSDFIECLSEVQSYHRLFFIMDSFECISFVEWYLVFFVVNSSNDTLEVEVCNYFLELTNKKILYSNWFIETVWDYLYKRGYDNELKQYFLNWLGPEGEAWNITIGERTETFNLFTRLLSMLDDSEPIIQDAKIRFRKSLLGFVEHKEDLLDYPFKSLKTILVQNSSEWRRRGLRLLNLSELVREKGDNLLYSQIIETILEAACNSGPSDFFALLKVSRIEKKILSDLPFIQSILKKKMTAESDKMAYWALLEALARINSVSDRKTIYRYLKELELNEFSENNRLIVETRLLELEEIVDGPHLQSENDDILMTQGDTNTLTKKCSIEQNIRFLDSVTKEKSGPDFLNVFKETLDLLGKNRNEKYRTNRDTLFMMFINADRGYDWSSQGLNDIVSKLFSVTTSQQNLMLFSHIVRNYYWNSEERYWLSSFTNNLNMYTINYLSQKDTKQLQFFYDMQIAEIENWMPNYNTVYKSENIDEITHAEWIDCIERLLVLIFSTNDILKTSDCFKGLYFFFLTSPNRWDTEKLIKHTMVRQKYLLLLLLEEFARNNVDISFAETFLNYCKDDSKLFSVSIAATLVLSIWKNTPLLLEERFGAKVQDESIGTFCSEDFHLNHLSSILGFNFKKDPNLLSTFYKKELDDGISEIYLDMDVSWRFMYDNTKEYMNERFLHDEISYCGFSIEELVKVLPIDDPRVMIEDREEISYDDRYFDLENSNEDTFKFILDSINTRIGSNNQILGMTWAKMTEKGEKLCHYSFCLQPNFYPANETQLSIGKILGRLGQLLPLGQLKNYEYNPGFCLFNQVFGTTIYFGSYKLYPSSLFQSIIKNSEMGLERKVFTVLNKDQYIHSQKHLNVSFEVWYVDKNELDIYLIENDLRLSKIIERPI
ncbi:TPA: ATP-binding protein [Enterococcus faecium]